MAAVDLTGAAPFRTARPEELDMGGVHGEFALQRVNQPGNRFQLRLTAPPIKQEPNGRVLAALLRIARKQGAIYAFPQPGLSIGATGTPVIHANVASGSAIQISGLPAGYTIRQGQFFSIVHGGKRYLYSAALQVGANSSGVANVTVDPMLRSALTAGDVVELAEPKIEGFITGGDSVAWEIMMEPFFAFEPITITEAA